MPISGKKYTFSKDNVDIAPAQAGVYALWDGDEEIYIGRAQGGTVTIRSRLQDHQAGRDGPCTQGASTYQREVTSSPVAREKELLNEYMQLHGELPRCNDKAA